MLKKLSIQQFVIIDNLDIDFSPGLTILTGETGAGKSILLDAMGTLLGEPSDPDAIRSGAEESILKALFSPPATNLVWEFLKSRNLAADGETELSVERTMSRSGQEKITLNGKDIDEDLLKKIGTFLAEIHGQFASQGLFDPANQLRLLDLSGNFSPELFKNLSKALEAVHSNKQLFDDETLFLNNNRSQLPKIEAIFKKFENLGMHEDFIAEAEAEHARLRTAKETSEAFQSILAQLIATNGVVNGLSSSNKTLAKQENIDPAKTANLKKYLETALENARASVNEMHILASEYDIDTKPLNNYIDILNSLKLIATEAKIDYKELTNYYVEIRDKLDRILNGAERLKEIESLLIRAKKEYMQHARILHDQRIMAAEALSADINRELAPLKLAKAEFQVKVEEMNGAPWTELGIDRVIFTARMNPGQPFSPVADTASGGELVRLILALKIVLQKVLAIPTLVFDEVDTGIGGSAAAAVGERIALLADTTQVVAITHSPQVASRGDQHLHVSKNTDGVKTTSVVAQLTLDERIDEISRMLAGDELTDHSHAAAKSLIDEARAAKELRAKGEQVV